MAFKNSRQRKAFFAKLKGFDPKKIKGIESPGLTKEIRDRQQEKIKQKVFVVFDKVNRNVIKKIDNVETDELPIKKEQIAVNKLNHLRLEFDDNIDKEWNKLSDIKKLKVLEKNNIRKINKIDKRIKTIIKSQKL